MYRNLFFVILVLFLLVGATKAQPTCVNVNASFQGSINPQNCSSLAENDCFLGTINTNPPYTIEILLGETIAHPTFSTINFQTATTVITAPNGNELYGVNAMSIDSFGNVADLLTMTGGTGPLNFSGALFVDMTINLLNQVFDGSMKGLLCKDDE